MKTISPPKLKAGDQIRVISPSRSLKIISESVRTIAISHLEKLGLKVSYGKNAEIMDDFTSSPIESRLDDLHDAFRDPKVKGILTTIGGFNCNQLLSGIDYDLIRANPKVLCGYSDITILLNAIYQKTGLITYYGPHFSTFGVKRGNEYTIEHFKRCLMETIPFKIVPSAHWSEDEWYLDQENRDFIPNVGLGVLNQGESEGTLIGGNLDTFNLLQGTDYMPSAKEVILFLEEDDFAGDYFDVEFDRNLESVLQQTRLGTIKGLLIGRFPKIVDLERIKTVIKSKFALKGVPVVYGLDFGHTLPILTLPVGGRARIQVSEYSISLKITEH